MIIALSLSCISPLTFVMRAANAASPCPVSPQKAKEYSGNNDAYLEEGSAKAGCVVA